MPDMADGQMAEWIEYYDPVETLAENMVYEGEYAAVIPESIARELHGCLTTHRENRQKLAKAVQARGYFVKSKGKGKSKDKSKAPKGKGRGKKGSGKARGMSLDELKKSTACADCGQTGHWRGDPECPRRANTTVKEEPDPFAEEEWDYEEGYEWHDGPQWSGWTDEYSRQADERSAHALQRQHLKDYQIGDDAETVNKQVGELRQKVRKLDSPLKVEPASASQRSSSQVTKSDYFLDKSIVENDTYPRGSKSSI